MRTRRIMPGLSDDGFALVMEMCANEAIDIDAIIAYVRRNTVDMRHLMPEEWFEEGGPYRDEEAANEDDLLEQQVQDCGRQPGTMFVCDRAGTAYCDWHCPLSRD